MKNVFYGVLMVLGSASAWAGGPDFESEKLGSEVLRCPVECFCAGIRCPILEKCSKSACDLGPDAPPAPRFVQYEIPFVPERPGKGAGRDTAGDIGSACARQARGNFTECMVCVNSCSTNPNNDQERCKLDPSSAMENLLLPGRPTIPTLVEIPGILWDAWKEGRDRSSTYSCPAAM